MEAELRESSSLLADLVTISLSAGEQEAARARWQSTATAYARLSGLSQVAARRVVDSMLNQMIRLAQFASWWKWHAAAAVAETVEYANGDLAVDSARAQRAWQIYWSAHTAIGELDAWAREELHFLTGQMADAEAQWRIAWDRWHTAHCAATG